jgi:integrase/recombinase XerD
MSTTISIILDTRRIKKTDKYPVKLRVTFKRVTEYYQTVFDLSKAEWEKLPASRTSSELQSVKEKLKEIERKAENVSKDTDPFNFAGKGEKYFSNVKYLVQNT